MSDLRDRFRALEADVSQLPRPSGEEVRRTAERRRRNSRLMLAAAGVAVALGGAFSLTQMRGDERDRIDQIAPSPTTTSPSAAASPTSERAWLPAPWRLERSTTYAWAEGTEASYQFCGDALTVATSVTVAEQLLVHPSGQRARLFAFTPEGQDPMDLFKFTYASCLADGGAESIGGPRNVWSYDGAAGAAQVVGGALWLVEVRTASPQQPATRRDAEAVLDAWTASAPRVGPDGPQLVPDGHAVVVRDDHTVVHVDRAGKATDLPPLPPGIGEPDAVVVDREGEIVMVSAVKSDDDEPSTCAALTLQLTADGRWHQVLTGAGLALSPDGRRLAYFGYATLGGFCRRASLVVRELDTGAESGVVAFDGDDGAVHGTPPHWPVNWSPDATRVAHVTDDGVVVTDVAARTTTAVSGVPGALAPVWLPDGTLVVLEGCCTGDTSARNAATGDELFALPGPVRSIRSARSGGPGAWITIEEHPLLWWDGAVLHRVAVDALIASG